MVKYGTMFVCHRCGAEKFVPDVRAVDTGNWTRGPRPGGWANHNNMDMCPTCTDMYNKMMNNFFAPEVKRPINLED